MSESNYVSKIAVVGASGRIGGYFARALVGTGKHQVTSLTRKGNNSEVPKGTTPKEVDYDDENSIVEAIRGHDVLIITLSVFAPHDLHTKIVKAGAKAQVKYICPNLYGNDFTQFDPNSSVPVVAVQLNRFKEVLDTGVAALPIVCGFWFEWSLTNGPECFGFDIKNRKVTLYDGGFSQINTSTWDQCGRAMAAILSLPKSGAPLSLDSIANKPIRISSFHTTQRQILNSFNHVLQTTNDKWEITIEESAKRQADGLEEYNNGSMLGYVKQLYAHGFSLDGRGGGNFQDKGLLNDALQLPEEDMDEVVKRVIAFAEKSEGVYKDA